MSTELAPPKLNIPRRHTPSTMQQHHTGMQQQDDPSPDGIACCLVCCLQEGVAIRAGHHCTQPLHRQLGAAGSLRASLYIYNTKDDVDQFIEVLLLLLLLLMIITSLRCCPKGVAVDGPWLVLPLLFLNPPPMYWGMRSGQARRQDGEQFLSHHWQGGKEGLAIGPAGTMLHLSSRGRVVSGLTAKACKT